jgi:hypothetical protein
VLDVDGHYVERVVSGSEDALFEPALFPGLQIALRRIFA